MSAISASASEFVRTRAPATSLRLSGLRKSFGGQVVLDGVSVELCRGEVVLLRGANGSGKTTLLNILTGNLGPDGGVIEFHAGNKVSKFGFPRPWWRDLRASHRFAPECLARAGIGRTWQEIRLFNSQDLGDNVAIGTPGLAGERPWSVLVRWNQVRREARQTRAAADALLACFGLGDRTESSADKISLGQSKRVAIARSIQARAQVLFLDEPLAGLDAPGVEEVLRLLQELAREQQVTMVLVEHVFNIPRILGLATTVWTLADGTLTVQTPAEVAAEYGLHGEPDDSDEMHSWLASLAPSASAITHHGLTAGARLSIVARGKQAQSQPALAVEDLVVMRGLRPVIGRAREDGSFEGLSFMLRHGDLAVLQAANGWGKTTLVEALSGTIPVQRGSIRIGSRDVTCDRPWVRVKAGLTLLQSRDNVFPNLTVRESLRLAGTDPQREELQGFADRSVGDLSGGQKQSVALASALSASRSVVRILDEPFGMLDHASIARIKDKITRAVGATLILTPATHDG